MRPNLVSGFIIPLVLTLLTSLVVFEIIRAHNRDFASVTATSRTSGYLNALIKNVVNAETGQRGFAITGDETFLEPYLASTTEFGVALSALRRSLPDDTSRRRLGEIDTLFERWHREVAGVVVEARRQAPVELSLALRGASTAFTQARVAALRYQLTGTPVMLSRAGVRLAEAQRQLGRALSLGVSGTQRTDVRAAAAAVARLLDLYDGAQSAGAARLPTLAGAGRLDDTLAQLATDAEAAEAWVTALIKAGAGKRLTDEIRAQVEELSEGVDRALSRTLALSTAGTRRTQWVAFVGPLFAAFVSLLGILQGQRRLGRSVAQLGVVVGAVAAGQLERRLNLRPRDELRSLAENFNRMADRLSERERQNAQLGQFSGTLQTCTSPEEAYRVSERFAPSLFGSFSGVLYRVSDSRNLLEAVARWGDEATPPDALEVDASAVHAPSDCWALRRGRLQNVDKGRGVACRHTPAPAPAKSLCAPLVTQDGTLGVLHLYSRDPATDLNEATERFVETVAEQLALALSNLRLRESLQQQSIRDPLTGLFNRRHLEETLELELHRAARRREPLSVVMFDIDHFKRYNDTFGHDAGDAVLRTLSDLVRRHIRAGDVAYRYGGEEFLLVQPGMAAADALRRAEVLRESVAALALEHQGRALGGVTLSLGIATYPAHAPSGTDLIRRADEALYRAKRGGRNRAVVTDSEASPA